MCDAMGVAIGMQAAGTLMQGIAAKQHGDAVKAADERSAQFTDKAAADAIERGRLKELGVAMHGSAVVAAQTVAQSESGFAVGVGGRAAVKEATSAITDVDRATVRRNAALEGYGLGNRARALRQEGENAEAEGNAAMVGTFLGGIGKGAEMGGKIYNDSSATPNIGDAAKAAF